MPVCSPIVALTITQMKASSTFASETCTPAINSVAKVVWFSILRNR